MSLFQKSLNVRTRNINNTNTQTEPIEQTELRPALFVTGSSSMKNRFLTICSLFLLFKHLYLQLLLFSLSDGPDVSSAGSGSDIWVVGVSRLVCGFRFVCPGPVLLHQYRQSELLHVSWQEMCHSVASCVELTLCVHHPPLDVVAAYSTISGPRFIESHERRRRRHVLLHLLLFMAWRIRLLR